ncbi:hypothetical protein AMTRI_Chr12g234440 [Amborella trichopoda]
METAEPVLWAQYTVENSFVKRYNGKTLPLYFKVLETIFGTGVTDGRDALGGGGVTLNRHDHQVTQGPSHDTNEEGADTAAVHTPSTSVPVVDLGRDEEFKSSSSEDIILSGKEAALSASNKSSTKKMQPTTDSMANILPMMHVP